MLDLGSLVWMLKFLFLVVLVFVGVVIVFVVVFSFWGISDVFYWSFNYGCDFDFFWFVIFGFGDCF